MNITEYKQLRQWVQAFHHGYTHLMFIRSRGGLGKSHMIREALPDALFFKGHATPLSVYMECLKHPNSAVVFDDVDQLLENKIMVALLKQLCELHEDKIVHYSTTYRAYGEEVPRSFVSNNKVILLCNDLKKVGANIGALLTRGFVLDFNPTNQEVIKQIRTFADQTAIVDELERVQEHLVVDFRLYEKCVEIHDSQAHTGLLWKDWLRGEFAFSDEEQIAREIVRNADLSRDQKYEEWHRRTGKSARTYHRVVEKLKKEKKV